MWFRFLLIISSLLFCAKEVNSYASSKFSLSFPVSSHRKVTALAAKSRKRRSKVGRVRKEDSSDSIVETSAPADKSSDGSNSMGLSERRNQRRRNDPQSVSSIADFDERILEKSLKDSKLPPLSGTGAAAKAKYEEKSEYPVDAFIMTGRSMRYTLSYFTLGLSIVLFHF